MFQILGVMFRKTAAESIKTVSPPALGRAELQNLFRDDFADLPVIEKRVRCPASAAQ